MNKNHLFMKGLIVIAILLLINMSIIPTICGYTKHQDLSNNALTQTYDNKHSDVSFSFDKVDHYPVNIQSISKSLFWWDRWPDFPGRYEPFFEVHDIYDFGQAAWGLTCADFNNDSKLDFAVSWATSPWTQSSISIMYSDGNGGFTRNDVYTIIQPMYRYFDDLTSGDFDKDGDLDLMFAFSDKTANDGTVSILFNDGNNYFDNPIMVAHLGPITGKVHNNLKIASADFDNDGSLDFLVGDNSGLVEFYKNDGNGYFSSYGIYDFGGSMSWGLSSADFDNDGDLDFIVTQSDSTEIGYIYLVYNDGTPNCFNQSNYVKIADLPPIPSFFSSHIFGWGCLCSLDYNNDGLMDFVFAGSDTIFLYMQNETGFFDYFQLMALPKRNAENGGWYFDDLRSGGISVGDFNGDDLDDMVIGGVQGVARICYNKLVLVDIICPDNAFLYISNSRIWQYFLFNPILIYSFIKSGTSIAIGDLSIEVKGLVPLQKVEFYLGDRLMYTDNTSPYEWNWTGFSFGRYTLKAVAYDIDGKQAGYDDAIVWKFL